jgi:D-3-phosphoglycerate dehydrogenase
MTSITLSVTGKDASVSVAGGTLASDGSPRLVRWGNHHDLDAHLEGSILVIKNVDRPGVIGSIGTWLGEKNINISRMQMGLDVKAGQAASLWALDSPLPASLLERIKQANQIQYACSIQIT